MSLAEEIARIASEYPVRKPRRSLRAVERLRSELSPHSRMLPVGVVGTNGKTSAATYLARLLTASGLRTGLYVSPHLTDWAERIRVDDASCDPRELLDALTAIHEVAKSSEDDLGELRFFDILTLAAELLIGEAGAAVAVFEAGIGGRLDAVRVLEPQVALLTSVALDHVEILGKELGDVLREKLLVAPAGATVLSFHLGPELDDLAERVAAGGGFRIAWVDPSAVEPLVLTPELPAYLRAALSLAVEGKRLVDSLLGGRAPGEDADATGSLPAGVDLRLPGRLECGERDGVPYVLDVAHNEAAWRELVAEFRHRPVGERGAGPVTVLVSVSPGKRREGLAQALRSLPALEAAIVTRHTPLPAEDPERVADELRLGGLEASAVEDVDAAVRLAFERAGRSGGGVLVLGSTHLVGDVKRWLTDCTPQPERARGSRQE